MHLADGLFVFDICDKYLICARLSSVLHASVSPLSKCAVCPCIQFAHHAVRVPVPPPPVTFPLLFGSEGPDGYAPGKKSCKTQANPNRICAEQEAEGVVERFRGLWQGSL